MSNFIPMVFAVLKDKGIDTKGMSAEEAVEKYNELTGKSGVYDTDSGSLKQSGDKQGSTHGLTQYTDKEKSNWKQSKKIVLSLSDEHIFDFILKARRGDKSVQGKKLLLGKLKQETADRIKNEVGINLNGYNLELRASDIKHAFNEHGNEYRENQRGQTAITESDIAKFTEVITTFDTVKKGNESNSLTFIKQIDGRVYAITYYAEGNKALSLKTMYKRK